MEKGQYMSKKNDDRAQRFGIGTFFISVGLLMTFIYENPFEIIGVVLFWFGFLGFAQELEKLDLRRPYIITSGVPSLITGLYYIEVPFVFIFFVSLSLAIFVSGLMDYVIEKFFYEKKETLDKSDRLSSILNIVGSICSIISLIIGLITYI